MFTRSTRQYTGVLRAFPVLFLTLLIACGDTQTDAIGGAPAMRRLTPEQYRNAIEDTFGKSVEAAGRFEPQNRRDGLNAIGESLVAVSPSGFEQYEALARNIAAQVTSEPLRDTLLPCKPNAIDSADDACTQQILQTFAPVLMRRPLSDLEIQQRISAARETANQRADFYAGLQLALASVMVSPEFLFRIEATEPAPTAEYPNRLKLNEFSLASKLSYFLWNRGPDAALMESAARGDLANAKTLQNEVERMLASPYLTDGVRAFFTDLFMFDTFDDLSKDVTRYPLYNNGMAWDAREQTLRFVVEQLVEKNVGYPALFTSKELPMTRSLGPVYGLPVRVFEGWEDITLAADNPRAGLLSHASFNMLHSHPGRSSATLRGVFLRETFMCQTVPEAPADVDFTQFSQDELAQNTTARDRLKIHSAQPSCKACHQLTDPIGLGLEVFDGIGRHRTTDNGAAIDTSGDFDGQSFDNPAELGQAFADNARVAQCLVQNLYRYSAGRVQTNPERRLLRHLEDEFIRQGYNVPALMRDIATSEAFRTATAAKMEKPSENKVEEVAQLGSTSL